MSPTAPADERPVRVSTEEVSPVLRALAIEVDADRVTEAFDRAYRDLGRRVRVRGFRPGKVPRSVLERLYGGAMAEEVERTLVAESLPVAIEQSGLQPVAEPTVDGSTPAAGAPFRYQARVEVRPSIGLPDLRGLSAKRPRVRVTDEDVEQELAALRERHAVWLEEPEGTPIAAGHQVRIDFVGRIDGRPFEGGTGREVNVEVGSGRFLPGFEERLEGARAGAELRIPVRFPEDHEDARLAGKQAEFEVRVIDVQRRSTPELDDEFAKDVGDFGTLGELRERIREELRAARERAAQATLRRTLLDALIERTSFPVPAGLVERRLERRLALAYRELERAMPRQALEAQLARWREEWRPGAQREVREEFLLEAVARERGIEVEEREVEQRLDALAREPGEEAARLRKAYREGGFREALRARIAREKAFDFLLGEAKVEETVES